MLPEPSPDCPGTCWRCVGLCQYSGAPLTSADLDASLKKANDPKTGKNVFPTMSVVKDWTVVDDKTVRLNFKAKVTDLLQFMFVIAKDTTETAETKVNGTGPFTAATPTPSACCTPCRAWTSSPNAWSPILVQLVILSSVAIPPPTPSWGEMLRTGKSFLYEAPTYAVLPGLALTLTILSLDTLGRTLARVLEDRREEADET